jgi:muramoyltetrapeptide carboxypeptidase LdcA involved in peptidoglycan recycling
MINHEYQKEILTSALDARIKEVTEYQVNIDNFRLAIERIGEDPELQQFKEQLQGLLSSSLLEQRKAQIMLDVIKSQLE